MQAKLKFPGKSPVVMPEKMPWLKLLSKRYMLVVEAIPDAMFLKDSNGGWWPINGYARGMFDEDPVTWQGRTEPELAIESPAVLKQLKNLFGYKPIMLQAGQEHVSEKSFVDAGGTLLDYEIRVVKAVPEDARSKAQLYIVRNISDRKRGEQSLQIADTAFEARQSIVVTDANNCFLRVNSAFTSLTGYSSSDVLGKTPAILKSGRHDCSFYEEMFRALKSDNFWQGEIWARHKSGEMFHKLLTINAVTGPDGTITNFVGTYSDISRSSEAEEVIHRLAFYDPLTNLPNRRLLHERLERAQAASAHSHMYDAVLFIDLDDFKSINDSKGHGAGDMMLVEMAQRLQSCVRKEDTVARLGGDEFVVLMENLSEDSDQAATIARRLGEQILEEMNRPCLIDGFEFQSSSSIGLCVFADRDITVEEILKCADTAMYQAKNAGRNCLRFYDPYMQLMQEARISLGYELRNALQDNQFRVYCQAQVNNAREVIGVEALVRWIHPSRGAIPPSLFIPVCEETGLIQQVGEWVLYTSCMQLKAWEYKPIQKDWTLSVNVSARQFCQPDFVERVCGVLEQTGANPARLKLELTESVVLHNMEDTISKMQALRLIGIHFAMDDFGTGYSSLSALKELPLDQLKIDKSFIREIATKPSDAVIVQTIIAMAKSLGLSLVVEGIETEEQFASLRQIGCPAYQGYLFGKPESLESFVGYKQ